MLSQDSADLSQSEPDQEAFSLPSKKRRRIAPTDDIEETYTRRLIEKEIRFRDNTRLDEHSASPSLGKDVGSGSSPEQVDPEITKAADIDGIPLHESVDDLSRPSTSEDFERTVFLGNVSIEAIKSKAARKVLLNHLSLCLSELQSTSIPHKVRSLRFRSTAFASGVGPRRAAYAKKELMEETSHSTNAYVVYTTQEAAAKAATFLNGTMVLDRHLRADLVARPAEPDHRRCVFIGNLSFVDEETIETETERGTKERNRRAKQPADAEEGLWRTFSKAGMIESVRVIRDRTTRVGKGIAYVQFYDENSVEAALLYNEKRFPPLLPRKLRVTRAKKPKNTSLPVSRSTDGSKQSDMAVGVSHPGRLKLVVPTKATRNGQSNKACSLVFEGRRATKPAAHFAKGGSQRGGHAARPTTRSSRRGAAFKATGGKGWHK